MLMPLLADFASGKPGKRSQAMPGDTPAERNASYTSMTTTIKPLPRRPAWKALAAHYKKSRALHIRKLFSADPKRGQRMTAEAAGA